MKLQLILEEANSKLGGVNHLMLQPRQSSAEGWAKYSCLRE